MGLFAMRKRERQGLMDEGQGSGPSPIDEPERPVEEGPSLRDAARSLYTGRHDPNVDVDMRVAASMGGVLWIGGGVLGILMLSFAPPTAAVGGFGWAIAGLFIGLALAIGVQRLMSPPPTGFGTLFLGSLLAVAGVAVLEWLAGGRTSPYHQLYALPVIYAAAVQPRRRALLMLALVGVVMWAPLLYAPPDRQVPGSVAGQLLLLLILAIAARMVLTLLRGQRGGLRSARERADRLARRDQLTGLGNRLHLEETLEVEVARARRQGTSLSLIVGDLDGFKAINDVYGHSGGDECLRRVAKAIGAASRTEDQCFRWGGDEFVVVLPDTAAVEAAAVRRRVCSAASGVCLSPGDVAVRMTCGTAELRDDDTVQSLLAAADEVLLQFKHRAERGEVEEAAAGPLERE